MSYQVALEYIPMMDNRTIVLAGMYLFDWSYIVKIGLFPGELPRESRGMIVDTTHQFQQLRLMHTTQQGSIFDPIVPLGKVDTAEVKFSEVEGFANGTETIFEVFKLNLVLRTILPNEGITVLQFMVNQHGQSIGLTFQSAERYVSAVYDAIGGPLVEDKKGDAP